MMNMSSGIFSAVTLVPAQPPPMPAPVDCVPLPAKLPVLPFGPALVPEEKVPLPFVVAPPPAPPELVLSSVPALQPASAMAPSETTSAQPRTEWCGARDRKRRIVELMLPPDGASPAQPIRVNDSAGSL